MYLDSFLVQQAVASWARIIPLMKTTGSKSTKAGWGVTIEFNIAIQHLGG